MADTFHQLPSVVARALDDDPELLDLRCVSLLRYAETQRAVEGATDRKRDLKGYDKKLVAMVERHEAELIRLRRKRWSTE